MSPEGAPAIYVHSRNNLIYSVATALYPAGVPYFVIWNPGRASYARIRTFVRGSTEPTICCTVLVLQ